MFKSLFWLYINWFMQLLQPLNQPTYVQPFINFESWNLECPFLLLRGEFPILWCRCKAMLCSMNISISLLKLCWTKIPLEKLHSFPRQQKWRCILKKHHIDTCVSQSTPFCPYWKSQVYPEAHFPVPQTFVPYVTGPGRRVEVETPARYPVVWPTRHVGRRTTLAAMWPWLLVCQGEARGGAA